MNSVWGRNTLDFFNHLTSEIYLNTDEADCCILGGDFNARIGESYDYVLDIDTDVMVRQCIDNVKAGHGEDMLDFLKESKLCILNGRVTPEFNNVTPTSTRGSSVVDCIVTGQSFLDSVKK